MILIVFIIFLSGFIIYLNQSMGFFIFSKPYFNQTYISFRFDDGLVSQQKAFDILMENNFTGSVYIISSKLNTSSLDKNYYLNLTQLDSIKSFMEIGSHSFTHTDLIYSRNYEYEIFESKKQLEEYGFNITTFVYPGGNYNSRVMRAVSKSYNCASTQDVGTNWMPLREYLLKDFTFRSNSDIQTLQRVIKIGKWNILTFHDIGQFNESSVPLLYGKIAKSNSVSLDFFKEVVDYVKENNMTVISISEGCRLFS